MHNEEIRHHSRWILRAMEWNDARARYPNIWHDGMPVQILAFTRVAGRLRLGDLIVVYYPASQRHPRRSERFLGISRVVALRQAHEAEHSWIELETAHRFKSPLEIGEQPRRVFVCCDPEWPEAEVHLFRRVFDAAVADGWQPAAADQEGPTERMPSKTPPDATSESRDAIPPAPVEPVAAEVEDPAAPERMSAAAVSQDERPVIQPKRSGPAPAGVSQPRLFAGVGYSGDMRDPRESTWLAIVELLDDRLKLRRLEATGRSGLQARLRNPDSTMMNVEAIGLDFPFGLPLPFAESLLGGPFPKEGWWALARKLERFSRPDYLVALEQFRNTHGEPKRLTDERAGVPSPLHRADHDLGPMSFHGIRMIAEDRSRFAIRPFETAQGKLLIEVNPQSLVRRLRTAAGSAKGGARATASALGELADLPLELENKQRQSCITRRDALDAVIGARAAAKAVLSGEPDRLPEELAVGQGDRVRCEGWIYGLEDQSGS